MNNDGILKTYPVQLDGKEYDLILGEHIADRIGEALARKTNNKDIVLVSDEYFSAAFGGRLTAGLESKGFTVYLYCMQGGKHNKTINEAIKIYEILEYNKLSRDSTIIALGGGVIGDLAGFVASTYLRGMNLVHVPTTMTAMIDSSIGGKVAVNFRKTINAIGNYYHPLINVVDLEFLKTLPARDLKAGLAEIIKCAVIDDADLFDYLERHAARILAGERDHLLHVMCRAIEIKLKHVTGDVTEQQKRLKLNYGHTMGHAIEVSTSIIEEVYRHGEGVALGTAGATHIADRYFARGQEQLQRMVRLLETYGLPTVVRSSAIGFDRRVLIENCMANIYKDKKRKDNRLRFILSPSIGTSIIVNDIPDDLVRSSFEAIIQ